MKHIIAATLAALTLCSLLVGCGSNTRNATNTRTYRSAPYNESYRGNLSTSYDGTVNGTNRYLDTIEPMDSEW